ncbi:hypothetical protein FP371_23070 [Citrobacter freundii]|uniref:hypothetical protein n=1 Tax=Enterobacteriaceae TaxID=543 RepID=UPI0005CFDD5D|nr:MULTISPECIES: hypothetical protein [Enterobacteriaceae]EEA2350723.1 hypothetical protein [Salmonella enterica subsp. enterica serovar Enteritidis]EEC4304143.1 hypothetical protein [Salmonella enterica subsp. enterica serovar Enteritidis]EEN2406567.1 hypothetical protein [Salmonella enterica subsp. enterica serovar Enteritidis]EES8921613.1 hypothetical protein [Escherichia coli]EES9862931.1 hypothetical protein [Escherichia coli]
MSRNTRIPIQFRLPQVAEEALVRESSRRNLSPNEYAKRLMTQVLTSDPTATERNLVELRLNATTTFTLLALVPFLVRLIKPELSEQEALELTERLILKSSREQAAGLLRSLGVEV